MNAQLSESWIGDIRWLVASGQRREVFRALGEHARQQVSSVLEELPELASLREFASGNYAHRTRAIVEATRGSYPAECEEIEALAEGAGVDSDDLLLLALRGDLGLRDDHGCSDFGWTDGRRALLGHNEDGDPRLHGLCSLLTLRIDGEPSVVTWWYPGFLPGNTCTLNEFGLMWGVDAIYVRQPQAAPGRAFAARRLQRAQTIDDMVAYLRSHPVAGAFTYVVGAQGSPRLVSIEQAGDQVAHFEAQASPGCIWHTNHLRYLPESLNSASQDSLARGAVLGEIVDPPRNPDAEWLVDVLTGSPVPAGVRAEGSDLTLCTFVADLQLGTLTLVQHGGEAVCLRAVDLLHGEGADISPGLSLGASGEARWTA